MIESWWSSLPASTQIYYWGYICLVAGFLTSEIVGYISKKIIGKAAWP